MLRATPSGLSIGTLNLHYPEQLELFPEDTRAGLVELVAIYRSKKYTTLYGDPSTFSEEYRLLWIEWKDGVAYRLGAADVGKKHWEALETEDVDLVLA